MPNSLQPQNDQRIDLTAGHMLLTICPVDSTEPYIWKHHDLHVT